MRLSRDAVARRRTHKRSVYARRIHARTLQILTVSRRRQYLLNISRIMMRNMHQELLHLRRENQQLRTTMQITSAGLRSSNDECDMYRMRSQKLEQILGNISIQVISDMPRWAY